MKIKQLKCARNIQFHHTKNNFFSIFFKYSNILKRHDNGHTSGHIYSEGRNDLDSALSGKDVRLPF